MADESHNNWKEYLYIKYDRHIKHFDKEYLFYILKFKRLYVWEILDEDVYSTYIGIALAE